MRSGDVQKLTSTWYELLSDYRVRNQDIAETCLKIIGLYIGKLFYLVLLLLLLLLND
jgi:hypothetical protein